MLSSHGALNKIVSSRKSPAWALFVNVDNQFSVRYGDLYCLSIGAAPSVSVRQTRLSYAIRLGRWI